MREEDLGKGRNYSVPVNPWKLCSVTKVEEVKMMGRLLPIWATTIIFWTTYAQMITFSVQQASTMNRSIGHFQIPSGSFTVFFVAAILMTLAVYDRIIMPLWKKWKGKQGTIFLITGLNLSTYVSFLLFTRSVENLIRNLPVKNSRFKEFRKVLYRVSKCLLDDINLGSKKVHKIT